MDERIPAVAYIAAQMLHRASAEGLLLPSVRSVEAEYGLKPGSLGGGIFLQTRTISLLYSLILIPKEFWCLGEKDPVYERISAAWSLKVINIKTDRSNWQDPIYRFIHHLRNALAHANFFFEGSNFEFWDEHNNQEKYRAALSISSVQQFLEVVGSIMANLRNERFI